MEVLLIVLVVVLAVFFAGGLAMAKALRMRSRAAIDALGDRLGARKASLTAPANLFGIKSAGKMQVRGNGHLALTDDALLFSQIVPARVLEVPRAAITDVGTATSYLGKTVGRDLLVVTWTDDEAAFYVRDLAGWRDALAAYPSAGTQEPSSTDSQSD